MERLKKAVKLAAKLREDSYDNEGSDKAVRNLERLTGRIPDYEKFYKLSLYDAADKAAEIVGFDTQGTQPVYLLLKHSWNEALGWADEKE